jgi:hypothetical protein
VRVNCDPLWIKKGAAGGRGTSFVSAAGGCSSSSFCRGGWEEERVGLLSLLLARCKQKLDPVQRVADFKRLIVQIQTINMVWPETTTNMIVT